MKISEFSKILENIKNLDIGHRNMVDVKIDITSEMVVFCLMAKDIGCYYVFTWYKGIDY